MTLSLDNAVVYDVECLPNCFTLTAETLYGDTVATWEISEFRDDREGLLIWFNWLCQNQIPMISFNGIGYDYPMIHFIWTNPHASPAQIYEKNQAIFSSQNQDQRFGHIIWERNRFAPQIDLFKINHFDNKAKTTGLKALQINMRSPFVVDSPVPFGQPASDNEIGGLLIPYNAHDVKETKRFAFHCMDAIKFRVGLIDKFGIEVLNYNDGKIGAKMLEQRLGEDVCYTRDPNTNRRVPRQTPRLRIPLAEIIFPYVQFSNPEFQRVLAFMRAQVLTPDDLDDPDATVKTKGVFKGLVAHVGGIEFKFGTGGVHGSVESQRFVASDEWPLYDIDVEGLYPNIAIKNRLAPEHLGERFTEEYANIPVERKLHAKGTYENASLKLAANVPWGQSNNKYSIFFDPKYAMTIPINGQLMLCMLVEWLLTVPTIQLIQVNTDGITYRIHRDHQPAAVEIQKQWQAFTHLTLEEAVYKRMWIRDVNNYVAEDMKGKLKLKGAYWHPDALDYAKSISTASPPAWHKDLGNIVSIRAANAAMIHGIDPEHFIRGHTDPSDFMLRVKAGKADTLLLGSRELQRVTRYYVARQGAAMTIIRPPAGPEGMFKRKNGVSEAEYLRVMTANNWQWSEAVNTGKASDPRTWGKYEKRTTNIEAGWQVAECNDARDFSFDNINYDYYVQKARKLIIG
jgi:hypothetical protein